MIIKDWLSLKQKPKGGSVVATIIISDNNWNKNYYVEEIFLYMMLPGVDMIRLTISRIKNQGAGIAALGAQSNPVTQLG